MDTGISAEEHVENLKQILDRLSSEVGDVIYSTDIPADNTPHNDAHTKYIDAVKDIFPIGEVLYINLFEEFRNLDLSRFFTFVSRGNEAVGIEPGEIDFVVITHGHADHIGRLPKLYQDGFRGRVIATFPTIDIAKASLPNSLALIM
ncbi:MAG: Beta-lactamase domain protein, partial [candidate division WWE3 bacterium GW2011_GWA1_42_12]